VPFFTSACAAFKRGATNVRRAAAVGEGPQKGPQLYTFARNVFLLFLIVTYIGLQTVEKSQPSTTSPKRGRQTCNGADAEGRLVADRPVADLAFGPGAASQGHQLSPAQIAPRRQNIQQISRFVEKGGWLVFGLVDTEKTNVNPIKDHDIYSMHTLGILEKRKTFLLCVYNFVCLPQT